MADDTRTLRVRVVGDSSGATRSLKTVATSADDVTKKTGRLTRSIGGLRSIMAGGLALGGVVTLGTFLKESVKGAQEATRVTRVLNSQVRNLGPAGRAAFSDAAKFATDFGAQIGVDDDDIKAVQAKLASFPQAFVEGSRGADGMHRSVKAAFDLQAIGIGTAESNIVGLGKAMNDPVKGMNALVRRGVSFSAVQKDQIKNAAKSGDLAKAQGILLEGIEKNAKGAAEAAVSPIQKMTTAVNDAGEKVIILLLPAINRFSNFVVAMLPKIAGLADKIGPKITALKSAFAEHLLPAAQALWKVIGPLLTDFAAMLGNVWEKAEPLKQLGAIFNGVQVAFEFIAKYKGVFQTIAVGILAVVAAQKLWNTATLIWQGIQKASIAIQAAWDALMKASTIGIIILAIVGLVAAVTYAWTHFAGFRVAVLAVWAAIRKATDVVVTFFMAYVWPVLKLVLKGLGIVFRGLWIAAKLYFTQIRSVVTTVVSFFMAHVWPTLKTVFVRIATAVRILWDAYSRYFGFIRDKVSTVVNWVRNTGWPIVRAAFELIKGAITTLWTKWSSTFNLIKSKVETVMKNAKTAFSNAASAIGTAWKKIENAAKVPVNFVINAVYNKGIKPFWNAIAGVTQLPKLPDLKGLASGGPINGAPGIVGDWVPFYGQAGEYVLNRKQVARLGGRQGIEEMAGDADRGGASTGHYAGGGIIGGLAKAGSFLASKASQLIQGSLLKVTAPLINSIKAGINSIPGSGDIATAIKKMPTLGLDKMLALIKAKDTAVFSGALGAAGGPGGWRWQVAIMRKAFPGIGVYSTVRRGATTLSGNRSYHAIGRAVDFQPLRRAAQFIAGTYGARTLELITPWRDLMLYHGRPHKFSRAIEAQHGVFGNNRHIHWAFDQGGVLPPGTTIAHNNTGRNEYVLTGEQLAGRGVTVNVTVQGNVTTEKDLATSIATAVRDELLRHANRNGGRTGLR